MVFYGDSNLAGYSLESERNLGGSHLAGCHYTYAGITARMFGAEYQNISRSGATISSLNTSFDRIDWTTNSPGWDFTSDPTDFVVVNIGANDYFRPKSQNKNRYHSLLDDLRAALAGLPFRLVVLAPDVAVAIARDAAREHTVGEEWARHLDEEQRRTMAGSGLWVDNSGQTAAETVDEVMSRLDDEGLVESEAS